MTLPAVGEWRGLPILSCSPHQRQSVFSPLGRELPFEQWKVPEVALSLASSALVLKDLQLLLHPGPFPGGSAAS